MAASRMQDAILLPPAKDAVDAAVLMARASLAAERAIIEGMKTLPDTLSLMIVGSVGKNAKRRKA